MMHHATKKIFEQEHEDESLTSLKNNENIE